MNLISWEHVYISFQALNKAGRSGEHCEEYVLEEVVSLGWERPGGSTVRSILDMGEKVLKAQNKWKGHGKFVLRKITNVSPHTWLLLKLVF